MRAIGLIIGAFLGFAANGASAQQGDGYGAFEVTRSAPRRHHAITTFEIAGAPVFINAYGRKTRARMFDVVRETREDRLHAAAFDRAARPPILTVEMRMRF